MKHFGTVSVGMSHPADRSLCPTIEVMTDSGAWVVVKVTDPSPAILRLSPSEAYQLAKILLAADDDIIGLPPDDKNALEGIS